MMVWYWLMTVFGGGVLGCLTTLSVQSFRRANDSLQQTRREMVDFMSRPKEGTRAPATLLMEELADMPAPRFVIPDGPVPWQDDAARYFLSMRTVQPRPDVFTMDTLDEVERRMLGDTSLYRGDSGTALSDTIIFTIGGTRLNTAMGDASLYVQQPDEGEWTNVGTVVGFDFTPMPSAQAEHLLRDPDALIGGDFPRLSQLFETEAPGRHALAGTQQPNAFEDAWLRDQEPRTAVVVPCVGTSWCQAAVHFPGLAGWEGYCHTLLRRWDESLWEHWERVRRNYHAWWYDRRALPPAPRHEVAVGVLNDGFGNPYPADADILTQRDYSQLQSCDGTYTCQAALHTPHCLAASWAAELEHHLSEIERAGLHAVQQARLEAP